MRLSRPSQFPAIVRAIVRAMRHHSIPEPARLAAKLRPQAPAMQTMPSVRPSVARAVERAVASYAAYAAYAAYAIDIVPERTVATNRVEPMTILAHITTLSRVAPTYGKMRGETYRFNELPDALLQEVTRLAAARGQSLGDAIREAVQDWAWWQISHPDQGCQLGDEDASTARGSASIKSLPGASARRQRWGDIDSTLAALRSS